METGIKCQNADFNPRPREEGDDLLLTCNYMMFHFNPRPREEGDLRYGRRVMASQDFNPRPREEGDGNFIKEYTDEIISIHALVKRATFSQRHVII